MKLLWIFHLIVTCGFKGISYHLHQMEDGMNLFKAIMFRNALPSHKQDVALLCNNCHGFRLGYICKLHSVYQIRQIFIRNVEEPNMSVFINIIILILVYLMFRRILFLFYECHCHKIHAHMCIHQYFLPRVCWIKYVYVRWTFRSTNI